MWKSSYFEDQPFMRGFVLLMRLWGVVIVFEGSRTIDGLTNTKRRSRKKIHMARGFLIVAGNVQRTLRSLNIILTTVCTDPLCTRGTFTSALDHRLEERGDDKISESVGGFLRCIRDKYTYLC